MPAPSNTRPTARPAHVSPRRPRPTRSRQSHHSRIHRASRSRVHYLRPPAAIERARPRGASKKMMVHWQPTTSLLCFPTLSLSLPPPSTDAMPSPCHADGSLGELVAFFFFSLGGVVEHGVLTRHALHLHGVSVRLTNVKREQNGGWWMNDLRMYHWARSVSSPFGSSGHGPRLAPGHPPGGRRGSSVPTDPRPSWCRESHMLLRFGACTAAL